MMKRCMAAHLLAMLLFSSHALRAQPIPNQSYATTADGVRIAIQEWGTPTGRPLLFVHGLLGSHLSWAKQIADPRLQKYRMVTYDLRGHGLSGAPAASASYTDGKLWADELKLVIETKHLDRPVVVGWSMGGLVLSNYLRLYGDGDLDGVVYVDGVIENRSEYFFPKPGITRLLASDDLAEHLEGTRQFVALCFHKPPASETFSTLFAGAAMASVVMTRAVLTQGISLVPEAQFPVIHVPALIVYGKYDRHLRMGMVRREKQLMPHASVSIYSDVGHSPLIELPDSFDRQLDTFVSSMTPYYKP